VGEEEERGHKRRQEQTMIDSTDATSSQSQLYTTILLQPTFQIHRPMHLTPTSPFLPPPPLAPWNLTIVTYVTLKRETLKIVQYTSHAPSLSTIDGPVYHRGSQRIIGASPLGLYLPEEFIHAQLITNRIASNASVHFVFTNTRARTKSTHKRTWAAHKQHTSRHTHTHVLTMGTIYYYNCPKD